MINMIEDYAIQLFRIFDILYSIFVSVCLILAIVGVMYMIQKI